MLFVLAWLIIILLAGFILLAVLHDEEVRSFVACLICVSATVWAILYLCHHYGAITAR